jgi:hypothetical protein
MNIPQCPNHLKSKSICEVSKLRLIGESDQAFNFFCASCQLLWSVTKPRTKEKARFENSVRKIQQASEIERQKARRRLYSFPGAK